MRSGRSRVAAALLVATAAFLVQSCGVVPTRSFLAHDAEPRAGLGGYGFVVFTSRPDTTGARATATCRAFLRSFPDLSAYGGVDPSALMVMYWPVSTELAPSESEDCGALLRLYDFARANQIASEERFAGAGGPVLVGYPSGSGRALVLDLSDFSEADIQRAFDIWKEHVSRDPAAWRDGFRLTVLREAFRNFLQAYGDTILRVVER